MVEVAGIEPASEKRQFWLSTCLVKALFLTIGVCCSQKSDSQLCNLSGAARTSAPSSLQIISFQQLAGGNYQKLLS